MVRKIIHIDMDAFYASIEQRDNPAYRGKPLAVGHPGDRGVVAAASYEARRYGVRSAMPSKTALRKCPHLIFVQSRFDAYKEVSRHIMDVFFEYTDIVEPLALDEAFLDVTTNHKNIESATQIAQEIRDRIFQETGLTASAGVSFNKFLAKIASDQNKPNGLFIIRPKVAEQFVEALPIEKFFGVGRVTAQKMHQMGIKTGGDLKLKTEAELAAAFGKAGHVYFMNARGQDDREVQPNRVRKSIGAENTFASDFDSLPELLKELEGVAQDVIGRISRRSFQGRTVTLKVKFADFRIITRSRTMPLVVSDFETLYSVGAELLETIDISPKVRLIGLTIKNTDVDESDWSGAMQLYLPFKEWDDE
ncbi:DNA polymerase-4 [Dysgonomonas sp. PH5-45]|uniref:DNA polymerase IV n=1 Tax=unclassified Dysgonomonas TaxID=2630389 RepID=UPI002473BB90|nr:MULTISPECIES: DNA polymerase IV [unclassified Dysgonomonas]MDH6354105.1 DNA polymerase-4 [Dysgonomonas sp. PH5-45]MDH6387044.1 DNA polymerase-4 [Dysgonomonas sp. PH5-37]